MIDYLQQYKTSPTDNKMNQKVLNFSVGTMTAAKDQHGEKQCKNEIKGGVKILLDFDSCFIHYTFCSFSLSYQGQNVTHILYKCISSNHYTIKSLRVTSDCSNFFHMLNIDKVHTQIKGHRIPCALF